MRIRNINYRVFSVGTHSSSKFTAMDLLGSIRKYYFIVGKEARLVHHLHSEFHKLNPIPTDMQRLAFKKILKYNNLICRE